MKRFIWIGVVLAALLTLPYEQWFTLGEGLVLAIGFVRGFLYLALIYFLFLWGYFFLRKKIRKRYVPEVTVILIALAVSIASKLLTAFFAVEGDAGSLDLPDDTWEATIQLYFAVFQSVGGLWFDGLPSYAIYETWRTIIVAGLSLVAGLVALSLITFSLSYEIYSMFAWVNFSARSRAKIYVFTAITEDSVALAHSIDEKNKKDLKEKYSLVALVADEKRKMQCGERKSVSAAWLRAFYRYFFRRRQYAVVFLRTEGQPAFDGKNPLHLDIMHSGFLFRTYDRSKSIPAFLRIKVKNDYYDDAERYNADCADDCVAEINVFALDWEKGKTTVNDQVVFSDIGMITDEATKGAVVRKGADFVTSAQYAAKKEEIRRSSLDAKGKERAADKLREERNAVFDRYVKIDYHTVVNYYFLSSEETDIANVDFRFDKELAKKAEDVDNSDEVTMKGFLGYVASKATGKEPKYVSKAYNAFKSHFKVYAINEADMAAQSFVRRKTDIVLSRPDIYASELEESEYRAMIVGFGQNGQQTMKAAYVFAAAGRHGEGENVKETFADSPLMKYDVQPFVADVYDRNAHELGGVFKIKHREAYVRFLSKGEKSTYDGFGDDTVRFRVNLNDDNALSETFLKSADEQANSRSAKRKYDYNLIVVALGNDDSNVSVANALIEDIKHELTASGERHKPQIIAINLRDSQNYDRINWCEDDEEEFPCVKVVLYGAASEMYSYDGLIDWRRAKHCNYIYSCISAGTLTKNGVNLGDDIRTICLGEDKTKGRSYTSGEYLSALLGDDDLAASESLWSLNHLQFYNKASSRYAEMFYPFMTAYAKIVFGIDKKDYAAVPLSVLIKLGAVEHDRWIRFMVANGYRRAEQKKLGVKEHCDIAPYNRLKHDNQGYDVINVLSAIYAGDRTYFAQNTCGDKI